MNDNDKASYGLTPMTVELDTFVYSNGCYADSPNTIAVQLKWSRSPYPNVYKQAIYVWKGAPPWYTGNVLYHVVNGSELTKQMRNSLDTFVFLQSSAIRHTLTGLTPDAEYYIAVQAQADTDDGYLSDIYITKFRAEVDTHTPMVTAVIPSASTIKVSWKPFAGYRPKRYGLYVWTGYPSWYVGDQWYNVRDDADLAVQMAGSSVIYQDVLNSKTSYTVDKITGAVTYYFGVVAWTNDDVGYTNVYILKKNILDTWIWAPRGEYTQNIDWGTNIIDFETGIKQYQQKYTQPVRTFSATFSGLAKTWAQMNDFIEAHKGNLLPFYLWVDEFDRSTRYCVRLAETKLNPKFQTEVIMGRTSSGFARHKTIGFTVDLSFIEVKELPKISIIPSTDKPKFDFKPSSEDDTTDEEEPTDEDTTRSPSLDDESSSDAPDTLASEDTTTADEEETTSEETTSADSTSPSEDTTIASDDELITLESDEFGLVLVEQGNTNAQWSIVGSSIFDFTHMFDVSPDSEEYGVYLSGLASTYGEWATVNGDIDALKPNYDFTPDNFEHGIVLVNNANTYGSWGTVNSADDLESVSYDVTPDGIEHYIYNTADGDTYGHWMVGYI